MATELKLRRGTTAQHSSFTGGEGEITVDTTKDTVVVHDGSTAGGHPLAKASELAAKLDTSGGTITGSLSIDGNTTLGNASGDSVTVNAGTTSFAASGARITGDFSNATAANRVIFQSSTTNGVTNVSAIPNGTATEAAYSVYNNSNTTNSGLLQFAALNTDHRIAAAISGTGTYLPMTFYTGGSERMRVDANGKVLIGATTARSDFFNTNTFVPQFQIEGTDSSTANLSITRNSNDNSPALLVLAKTRGTSVGGTTIVQSGDLCGQIAFQGSDGTELVDLARIGVIVDGTPGANDMPGALVFRTTADGAATTTERMRLTNGGDLLIGRTVTTAGTEGIYLDAAGTGYFERSSGACITANRLTSDGTVFTIQQATVIEGTISVSGTTVSYNAFAGSHWSQLQDGSKPNILRGTVMESIDELVVWPNEPNTERLCKVKVSDTAGSKKVYGVFMDWDNDWEATNDLYVTSLGAFVCRVNSGVMVQVGDLLESNGDGTARVQADDIIRSSTIGKVTGTTKTHMYPDGSYCVPTVLYCG